MFLLVLYGTGLRVREAHFLTLEDVDLDDAVLTVRDTKFYKNRLVPVSARLNEALKAYYINVRSQRPFPSGEDSAFLAYRDGSPLTQANVIFAFARLRKAAGISANGPGYQCPMLKCLRHTFAVHRLTAWYQQGADVQQLLPLLSTYLGHKNLNGTQVYLSMTPELLQQASSRFNHYVNGDRHE